MKLPSSTKLFLLACLWTGVASFSVLDQRHAALTTTSSTTTLSMAMHAPIENANSQHHAKATVAALALAALLWAANPVPLHNEASAPHAPTAFPTLVVSKEIVAPTTTMSKLQVNFTPGFGFGGLGIGPFGVGPFGGLGGGVVIRNVPPTSDQQQTATTAPSATKEQQLEALVKQQRKRLEQYERLERLQQLQKKT